MERHCQSKVAGLSYFTEDRGLGLPELTPLGKCGCRYASDRCHRPGRAHGTAQLTGDPFSPELALLLLDIPWAIIERFLILPEIVTRGEISGFIGAKREC